MTDIYLYTDASRNKSAGLSGYAIVFDRRSERNFLSSCVPVEDVDRTELRHVGAHTGDEFNELADRLALEATYGNFVKTFQLWV